MDSMPCAGVRREIILLFAGLVLALAVQDGFTHDECEEQCVSAPDEPACIENCRKEQEKSVQRFTSYEPNVAGYAKDDNDEKFLDFKVSLKYRMYEYDSPPDKWYIPNEYYLAFTGRFGQYIKTRDSSPVIGKRFNPALILRYRHKGKNYLDFSFGHESNGQNINEPDQYAAEVADQIEKNGDASFARDKISRGWDYLGVTWKNHEYFKPKDYPGLTTYYQFRYFLDNGPLQGEKEEWFDFEDPGASPEKRAEYDGISILGVYEFVPDSEWLDEVKFAIKYTTGYESIFENNTLRFEAKFRYRSLPLLIWVQQGYNSDLVDYYKNVTSVGIGFEVGTPDLRDTGR